LIGEVYDVFSTGLEEVEDEMGGGGGLEMYKRI
jgi:hypothetical protein